MKTIKDMEWVGMAMKDLELKMELKSFWLERTLSLFNWNGMKEWISHAGKKLT